MELYQLKSFVAVADEGHLTRAGERLHLSQSALSGQIKALEDELGVSLFTRTSRGMALTEAGRRLKARADAVLDASRGVLEEAASLRGDVAGVVRVGLNTDPVFLRVPRFRDELAGRHPGLSPYFTQSQSITTPEWLRRGDLDAGFLFSAQQAEGVAVEELTRIGILACGPAAWREKIEHAGPRELAELPWLWTAADCPCFTDGHEMFCRLGVEPRKVLFSDSEDVMRELVVAGTGLAFLRQDMAEDLESAGAAAIWKAGPPLSMPLSIAFLARRRTDPAVAAVIETARAVWGG